MTGGQKTKTILLSALLGLLLGASLVVTLLLSYYYLSANWRVFPALSLLGYGEGWSRLWLILWLGSDALFFILVALILLEIVLFLLRTIVGTGIRAHGRLTNRDVSTWTTGLKRWSLLTVFRAMGINDRKKGVIAYFIVILVVFGPGWLGKTVLDATDNLVYRTKEQRHLQEETRTVDFAAAISAGQSYDLSIAAGVGIIHLYTSKDTPEGRFHFLYDNASQKADFTMEVDETTGSITIGFGGEDAYRPYLDPVPSAVEIFLPSALEVDSVSVSVDVSGFLTVSYLSFSAFSMDLTDTQVSFNAEGFTAGDVGMTAVGGTVDFKTGNLESLDLDLNQTVATVETGTVSGLVQIRTEGAQLNLFRTVASRLAVEAVDSDSELREVYASEVDLDVEGGSLLFRNNDGDYAYESFSLTAHETKVSTAGVPYDPQGND